MKRTFDFFVSLFSIIVLSPVIILVALFVLRNLGSPVFFKQERPGKGGKPFEMLKFRSMLNKTDKNGNVLPDSERLTSFGRFLRSTSLDELPSLLNVLKGDMSLVGPRPLLMQYLPLYTKEQSRRHEVRPGVTGWAQVNGRNALSWEDKFKLDVWYVDNQSFWLDIKILLLTVKRVLVRDGINAEGEVTMSAFKGTDQTYSDLYILGAGGFAREVYSYLADKEFIYDGAKLVGFLDDNRYALDGFNVGHQILGDLKRVDLKESDCLILAIANPSTKEQVFNFYNHNNGQIITYIHDTAIMGHEVNIGVGCVFAPYSLATTNVNVGKGCTINAFSSIGHDAFLGDFCTISGHCDITGNVKLGNKVFMGSHASIIPNVQVGDSAMIGAGSLVVRKVKENASVFGNPAKRIM